MKLQFLCITIQSWKSPTNIAVDVCNVGVGGGLFNIHAYKIIATCIERATALRANNTCVTRTSGSKRALLFTIDKLISGSSLEGKEATKL